MIVQSGITDRTLDAERGALVAKPLCEACRGRRPRRPGRLPVDTIVDAQAAVLPQLLKPVGMMPFHPVRRRRPLDAPPAAALARRRRRADVPLLAGTTRRRCACSSAPLRSRRRDRLVAPRRPLRRCRPRPRPAQSSRRYEADVGDRDGVWPALFSDVEMQVPLRRVLEHTPRRPRRRTRTCSRGRARHSARSTRSTSRSRSTSSTSTAGATSSAPTTTRHASGATCATPGGRIRRATAIPAGPRTRRPTSSGASRSDAAAHPLFASPAGLLAAARFSNARFGRPAEDRARRRARRRRARRATAA